MAALKVIKADNREDMKEMLQAAFKGKRFAGEPLQEIGDNSFTFEKSGGGGFAVTSVHLLTGKHRIVMHPDRIDVSTRDLMEPKVFRFEFGEGSRLLKVAAEDEDAARKLFADVEAFRKALVGSGVLRPSA